MTTSRQDNPTRQHEESSASGNGPPRHRQRQESADRAGPANRRRGMVRSDDAVAADFFHSDPEAVDDSLIGCDSDLEIGRRRGHAHSRNHAHGHGRRTRGEMSGYRVFIALFDYFPASMSPNPGAIDEELPFCEGQLMKACQTYCYNNNNWKTNSNHMSALFTRQLVVR